MPHQRNRIGPPHGVRGVRRPGAFPAGIYRILLRATRGERGQGLIEVGLALPILLAVAGAVIDGAWAFHQAGLVAAAAGAAERAAAIQEAGAGHCAGDPPASDAGAALGAAQAAAPTLNAARLAVSLRYLEPACTGRMRTLVASVQYPITALTPWLAPLLNGRLVTAQAATAVEELPPPWWGGPGQIRAQQAQIQAQQGQIAGLAAEYQSALARAQSAQEQVSSLAAAYQAVAADLQGARSEITTLTAADQSEEAIATYWWQTAGDYYGQWQSASAAASAAAQQAAQYYGSWQSEVAAAGAASQEAADYYSAWQQALQDGGGASGH